MRTLWFFFFSIIIIPLVASQCADSYASSCGNGAESNQYGYACPHMMMLSDAMINATKKDQLFSNFHYAVAGGANDQDCGVCYQVQLLDAEREWRPTFKQLIVQVVNSGFDVMPYQLDIFMGAGGFGFFTSCNRDCNTAYCNGGACRKSMYDGTFKDWVNAQYNDPNLCYSGGIKWLDQKQNASELLKLCKKLVGNENPKLPKNKATIDSCFRTNTDLYHQNFVSTKSRRVQCPKAFTDITGLKRLDDRSFPLPSKNLSLINSCIGDRTKGHYCITTMQDCCKMSCSWSGKIPSQILDTTHPCIFTCNRNGDVV